MTKHIRTIAPILLLAVVFAQSSCTSNQLQAFKSTSNIVVASANGINATLNDLITQGKITGAFADWIKSKLPAGLTQISNINVQVQELSAWPPPNKQAIIDLIQAAITFIENAQAEGLLKFGNSNVVSNVTAALAVVVGVLATLKSTLDGSVAAPAALQQLKGASGQLQTIERDLQVIAAE